MNLDFQRDEPKELKERVYKITCVTLILFGILFLKLWYLQILKAEEFKRLSENNRIRLVIVNPKRGKIFDREGRLLVDNRPSFNLTVIPEDVNDWEKLKKDLIGLISITPEEIDKALKKGKERAPFQPVILKGDLPWKEIARIETYKLGLPGVSLEVKPRRHYIYGDCLSPLIGYIGEIERERLRRFRFGDYRVGDLVGKDGIEGLWEETLRGRRGGLQVEVDALGRIKRILREVKPVPGNDIYLTIDLDLQVAAKEAIGDKVGSVIAMRPATGEILAMVSNPSYDPNAFAGSLSREEWKRIIDHPFRLMENKGIHGLYPPASTFKIVTAAIALEEGIINKYKKVFSGGSFPLGNRVFRDWKREGHGWINIHQAIVESADTFFYQLGLKLGADKIARYARLFGFGRPTGIDLAGEKAGLVPTSGWKMANFNEKWYDGETLLASIGQGYLLTTPLQVLNAYASVANGGKVLKPQLIKKIVNNKGESLYKFSVKERGRLPFSRNTLNILKNALRGVVNEDKGTGRTARIKGIEVAGKTGTAQVVRKRDDNINEEEKMPYKLRNHSWFVGFAPYNRAEIAVVVLIEHGGYGASTAAPIAKKVLEAYFKNKSPKNSVF